MREGDLVVIWRERFLPDNLSFLLGQRARIVSGPRHVYGMSKRPATYLEIELLDTGISEKYNINIRAMRKIGRLKPKLGSWDNCVFQPSHRRKD
jgi:hypothetical protein